MKSKSQKDGYVQVGSKPLIAVNPALPSFEGHPFFEKKALMAKELLKKAGLPKPLSPKTR